MRLNAVVVEDNAVFRQQLTEYLEAFEGVELIDCFTNGEALLAQLARLKPDVVLLDIGMPGLRLQQCCVKNDQRSRLESLPSFRELRSV